MRRDQGNGYSLWKAEEKGGIMMTEMNGTIFGCDKEDWDRWQQEHREWQESLDGLDFVPLWPGGAPDYEEAYGQEQPKLCLLPRQDRARGMVLICAGGGFHMKSVFEGRMVAQKYHDYGFNAAVLDYRCLPYPVWDALADAQRAVRLLRYHAKEWNIDPEHIGIGGFSAGGHLSSMAATLYADAEQTVGDNADQVSCRPDALIQCYGAIDDAKAGNFLGEHPTPEMIKRFVPSRNVTADMPPVFLWMTREDEIISRKSLYHMAEALEDADVPYELHVFPKGIHGIALADGSSKFGERDVHAMKWMELSCEWLESLGF